MFHNTSSDLQDQDQDQDQDRFFWSQTGLVLRPTVSDHIIGWLGDRKDIRPAKSLTLASTKVLQWNTHGAPSLTSV